MHTKIKDVNDICYLVLHQMNTVCRTKGRIIKWYKRENCNAQFTRIKYICHLWYIWYIIRRILNKLQKNFLWTTIADVQDREYRGDQKLVLWKKGRNKKDKILFHNWIKWGYTSVEEDYSREFTTEALKKTVSMYEHTIKRIWNGKSRTDIRISYASILTP